MRRPLHVDGSRTSRSTPIGMAGRGLCAGLVGTLVLSLLSRTLPGVGGSPTARSHGLSGNAPSSTLAPALTIPQSPGPEGLAEQFAYKVASGVFGRELVPHTQLAGRTCHLAYGSAWGALYGLLQASYPRPAAAGGPIYGLVVWTVGPALIGPAMRIIERPSEMHRDRMTSLLVGHLAYGLGLA